MPSRVKIDEIYDKCTELQRQVAFMSRVIKCIVDTHPEVKRLPIVRRLLDEWERA